MKVVEQQYKLNEPSPKQCSYCDEEKKFIMIKPMAMAFDGEVAVNINRTNQTLWTCLECWSMDLDALGHYVDIHEID